MKEYNSLIILIGFTVMLILSILPTGLLLISQIAILVVAIIVYVGGDSNSISFLQQFKFILLVAIVLYFFLLPLREQAYFGISDGVLFFSRLVVFFDTFFLFYILFRTDRLIKIMISDESNKEEDE